MAIDYEACLARILPQLFPDEEERAAVVGKLARYGEQSHHREIARVRLSILKLSRDAAESLDKNIAAACADYRDVLSWAEYPLRSRLPNLYKTDPGKYAALAKQEKSEYLAWLANPELRN